MYPQKAASQIPRHEGTASGKPHGRFTRVYSACNDVIFGRVRGFDPASGILLQLFTCGKGTPSMVLRADETTHVSFC
jgi:hypothetical protein